ncbi:MAG: DMT family transporter [Pseudomonadota bacterium]|nr:DMT family transporter [Pseudomonadota bacterium]
MTSRDGHTYSPALDTVRGIFWMLLAVTMLTMMFTIVKQMITELPVFVVAISRTFFALCMLLPWLYRMGMPGIRTARLGRHFIRSFFGISAFVCVIFSLEHLILADAMVLAFTSPFWSILIGAIVLHETIRGRRIAATVVGFFGVIMIIKPHGGIEPAMLLALLSAILASSAMISMKTLSSSEPPTRIVFYFMLFGTFILIPPALISWETPDRLQTAWLLLAGALGAIGQDCLARAYDAGEISIVAPFDFVRLPIAALLGYIVFSELPDLWSIAGTATIIGAAVYLLRHGQRDRNEKHLGGSN